MPGQPAHMRNGRVSGGNQARLNQKAIKVLSSIKFSPKSVSREDIVDATGLSTDDVSRQVKLLLTKQLIASNRMFPAYPRQGWMVFTEREKHTLITNILKQHGVVDPRTAHTRQILGDYYPTGMDLEGRGRQPYQGYTYTKGHPVIPELEFRPEALAVMAEFRDRVKPFKPRDFSPQAVEEKKGKWSWFVQKMSEVYGLDLPRIEWGEFTAESWVTDGSSGNSFYRPGDNTLGFSGKFSLVTLLHEFGHARGFDERDTIIWSINLGLRTFPVTFNRLLGASACDTHMMTRGDTNTNFQL